MTFSSSPFLRSSPIVVTLVTLAIFWLLDQHDWYLYKTLASGLDGWSEIVARGFYRYTLPWLLAPLLAAALLFGPRRAIAALGLNRSPVKALAFGLFVTAPMLIALAATAPFSPGEEIALSTIRGAVFPGFFEEVFYRAFLFGFLFRFARWGFLPAALIGALMFGAAHLYQSDDPAAAAGIFAITAIGGLWFAWLYVEWDYNIWVPSIVHMLMNFWWMVFAVAETALGPPVASASRIGVILASIIVTIIVARKRGGRIVTGKAWLWGGPGDEKASR